MTAHPATHGRVAGRDFALTLVLLAAVQTVRVEVADTRTEAWPSATPPPPADPDAETGRGLLLVDALATRWGVTGRTNRPGKTAWTELVVTACPAASPQECEDRERHIRHRGAWMSVLIRPARATEAELLSALALRSKAHWGYDAAFLEACKDELTLDEGEVADRRTHVADRAGHVLGFTTLEGEPPTGVLGMMFVEPQAIGQGVGRLLFEHTVAAARELGFARITLDADPHAEPFYRAVGAVRAGSAPSGSLPGRVLPRMIVSLVR